MVKGRLSGFGASSLVGAIDVVRFENVGLRYGNGREILKDISFTIAEGSLHCLTGPSGAGKSTLLKLLFLALRPTRGLIKLFNRDIAVLRRTEIPSLRRRIGVVFQDFKLLDHLTTAENVALPLRAQGRKPDSYRADVLELLDWVGLKGQSHFYPPVLSGGEKQRAAIARAVVGKPDLLLADEPTGNVDPALAMRLLHLFQQLNRFGTTVVIATHDPQLVTRAKALVMRLEDGELSHA